MLNTISINLCNYSKFYVLFFPKNTYESVNERDENDGLRQLHFLMHGLKLNHIIEHWFIIFAKNMNVRIIETAPDLII